MEFHWKDYYDLAKELGERNEEAALRCAISRTYYAIYCSVLAEVKAKDNYSSPTANSHKALWDYLNRYQDKKSKKLADYGRNLRKWRTSADYEYEMPGSKLTSLENANDTWKQCKFKCEEAFKLLLQIFTT